MPRGSRPLFAALAVVLVLAACDSGGGNEVSTRSTTTATEATGTTGATPSTGPCSLPGATTDSKAATSTAGTALLTGVRTGNQPCAERVVFDFRGADPPGYTVEYQPGPFTFGESGEVLAVAGSAFLVVRLEPASGVDLTDPAAAPTYEGPASITPSGVVHVAEIRRLSDFEAQLVWVIGLDEARPFTVSWLSDPARVYVDIAR